jgi:hypothetical protein
MHREHAPVAFRCGNDLTSKTFHVLARLLDIVDGFLVERFALFQGEDSGHILDPVLPELVDALTHGGAFKRGPVTHFLGGLSRRRHRPVDVGRRRLWNVVDVLAGDG